MSGEAFFVVRAVVADESARDRFDEWYSSHHLPLAMEAFGSTRAWRFWSTSEAAVHYAVYQFASQEAMQERLRSEEFRALVADFDDAWPSGVSRTRELLTLAEVVRA